MDLPSPNRHPKRPRGDGPSGYSGAETKRAKNDSVAPPVVIPRCLIAHEVTCENRNHEHDDVLFEDQPRLFKNDNKRAALRGKKAIKADIYDEEFAEENLDIDFIVVRSYNCEAYHREMKEQFVAIPLPRDFPKISNRLKLELAILSGDGVAAKPYRERVVLISKELQDVLDAVRHDHPAYFSPETSGNTLHGPYADFYHARSLFKKHSSEPSPGTSRTQDSQLSGLVRYIESSQAEDWLEADSQFEREVVTRSHFSKLFCPDDIIISTSAEGPVGGIVTKLNINNGDFQLKSWNWGFDGRYYKVQYTAHVEWPHNEEEVKITSLSSYPKRFAKQSMQDQLHERGKKFWQFRQRTFVEYETTTRGIGINSVSNRYMIDLRTYQQMHADAIKPHGDEGEGIEEQVDPPEYPFLVLLPATILGYGFHNKKWSTLLVEQTRPVRWSDEIFDRRLVMKSTKKELIKALVTVHTARPSVGKADIIEGKGGGLILLLHGAPGTGKTLTAESIAEYARKPLYRVTCGDIGTDAEGVETYLESVFYIGTVWDCVVLLDEADVFLEERTPTDLQRNALVSVFLRRLEYFEGIMVLTSNRIGTFDEAFKSRVQLAVHYPPLDRKGRWEVWSMLLQGMLDKDEAAKMEELREKIDFLARHKLNGRQIRNTINTSRQLARFRQESMAYSHIEQALEVVNEFEEYVTELRGHSDEDFAQAQGYR